MKVFISWSGELSGEVAKAFKEWLSLVLQFTKPFFTRDDIRKGARWSSEIAKKLEESQVGVFCLTRENLESKWMHFEAGAVSKNVDDTIVCSILFDLKNSDVEGPLSQFQLTQFEKKDVRKLVGDINERSEKQELDKDKLDRAFEKWWPDLETQVEEIMSREPSKEQAQVREDGEILEEILSLTRSIARHAENEKEREQLSWRDYDRPRPDAVALGSVAEGLGKSAREVLDRLRLEKIEREMEIIERQREIEMDMKRELTEEPE